MTDDLTHLQDAMKAATPEPSRKEDDLALAMKNFDDFHGACQGSADAARPTSDRPEKRMGLSSGVFKMFHSLTTRGALAATTSIVAIGIGVLFYTQRGGTTFDFPMPEPAAVNETQAASPPMQKTAQTSETVAPVIPETAPTSRVRSQAEAATRAPVPDQGLAVSKAPMMRNMAAPPVGGIVGGAIGYNDAVIAPPSNTETFANADANPVKITTEEPVSTFSIDVDTASYTIVRSSLMNGQLPNPDAVRIEEMVNYFPYNYPAPEAGEAPFKPTVTVLQTPWNSGTKLVHIGIQGELPALEDRPPLNLVFLIDTSGSMNQPNKLPLLIQSFRLMLSQLHPDDEVSIVTYAGSAGQVLEPTRASDKAKIMAALENLQAGGSTAGQQGLQQAYAVAEGMAKDGETSRIILATDGDFNVGKARGNPVNKRLGPRAAAPGNADMAGVRHQPRHSLGNGGFAGPGAADK